MGKRVAHNGMVWVGLMMLLVGAIACGDDNGGTAGSGAAGASGASGMTATGGTSGTGTGGTSGTGTGGTSGVGGGNNDIGPTEICMRVAQIQCAAEADCCDSPGRDVPTCESAMRDLCEESGGASVATDPIVGFDQDALTAALDELESRIAPCDPAVAAWAITSDGFQSAFTGSRAAGANCSPEGGDNATIEAIAAALVSCQNVATTACLPGADTASWMCAPRGAAGGLCFTDFNCQEGLYCGPTATCVARKTTGADCDEANECASFLCADGACAASTDQQAAYCLAD